MSLPIDFTTALWFVHVPVWEWEPLPCGDAETGVAPSTDGAPAAPGAGDGSATPPPSAVASACGPASDDGAAARAPAEAGVVPLFAPPVFAPLGIPPRPEGAACYRLAFKGFKVSTHLMMLPFDTLLARPWVRNAEHHAGAQARERDRPERHRPERVPPEPPVPEAHAATDPLGSSPLRPSGEPG